MNVELLRRIKVHILEEPKRLYMGFWRISNRDFFKDPDRMPECGTVACIGGWAEVLSGNFDNNPEATLDITQEQASRLFYESHWPAQFRDWDNRGDGSEKTAHRAADRIEHFIATEGRE